MKKNKPSIAVIGLKGLPAFGGAATVGENIIEQIKDKYDFTVYSTSTHTDLKTGDYNGYKQIVFKAFFIKKINVFIYYILSAVHSLTCHYDLIHLHHSDWAFIIPILKIKNRVLLTSHGSPNRLGNRTFKYNKVITNFFKFSERVFLKKADTVSCVSRTLAEFLRREFNKEIHYIPNGFSYAEVNNSFLEREFSEKYILFAAGRILPTKGCHIFLEALKKNKYSNKIIIVGDYEQIPSYYEVLIKIAQSMDVIFTGMIKDKNRLNSIISNAELFVFPSSYEAMSMMLLEVASLKVPIICSEIDENRSIFNDDEILFFKTDDVSDLAIKLKNAENNKVLMNQKAQNAFTRLEHDYLWDSISKKYEKLYQRIIQKG